MTLPKKKRRLRPKLIRDLQRKARGEKKLKWWLAHVEERNKKHQEEANKSEGVTKVTNDRTI